MTVPGVKDLDRSVREMRAMRFYKTLPEARQYLYFSDERRSVLFYREYMHRQNTSKDLHNACTPSTSQIAEN